MHVARADILCAEHSAGVQSAAPRPDTASSRILCPECPDTASARTPGSHSQLIDGWPLASRPFSACLMYWSSIC